MPDLNTLTAVPADHSPSELDMKTAWLGQMMGERAAGHFPNLTAVSWFKYVPSMTGSHQYFLLEDSVTI